MTEKSQAVKRRNVVIMDCLILLTVFVIMFTWSFLAGSRPAGPDEPMRYDVANWLYHHPGQLPRGDAPELRNPTWGISYAFYPVLSYMISAVFMWIVSIFNHSEGALLQAARFAPTVFMTIASWYVLKSGRRLFGLVKGTFFACLIIFLPGFHYLGTYVNNDSLSLMAAAIIFYAWVCVLDEGWNRRNCLTISIGMGICFLSYYNAYGWILCSFFFFCLTILVCSDKPMKERWKEFFSKGIFIAVITLLLSAWAFIRNAILYDGDFFGRRAVAEAQEKYAIDMFKVSNHPSMRTQGYSIKNFLLYQDPGWPHNWLLMSLVSFVGVFGVFDLYMEESVSKIYVYFIFITMVLVFITFLRLRWMRTTMNVTRVKRDGYTFVTKETRRENIRRPIYMFNACLVLAMIIPFMLYFYYAYCNDLQSQGRYYISSVFAVMYFVTLGFGYIVDRIHSKQIKNVVYWAATSIWTIAAVLNYTMIVIPNYR